MDTIYALASARGKSGIAVVRVSGPLAFDAGTSIAGSIPAPRQTALRMLTDGQGENIDQAVVAVFKAGHSFTGENVVELQIHGSIATVRAVLERLSQLDGMRLADPGEFTRRALENDRLDLTQVEGLADLIDAETDAQRRQALRVLSGELAAKAEAWRSDLIHAAALLEATIDFSDEDVPVDVTPEVDRILASVREQLKTEAAGVKVAERIRDGFEVAIVGPPNVGKSTLLNALAGRDAAITAETAGTTRDVIEVRMDINGLAVTVLDTAGLRETDDIVESMGVERAIARASGADLRVFLTGEDAISSSLIPSDHDIVIPGKVDLSDGVSYGVSGKTGQGLSLLIERISDKLDSRTARATTATNERHRLAILCAIGALDLAESELKHGPERSELAAEELRSAIRALESLVGRVDVEQVLDEIFASFCLGK